jgi:hypothetical protein
VGLKTCLHALLVMHTRTQQQSSTHMYHLTRLLIVSYTSTNNDGWHIYWLYFAHNTTLLQNMLVTRFACNLHSKFGPCSRRWRARNTKRTIYKIMYTDWGAVVFDKQRLQLSVNIAVIPYQLFHRMWTSSMLTSYCCDVTSQRHTEPWQRHDGPGILNAQFIKLCIPIGGL